MWSSYCMNLTAFCQLIATAWRAIFKLQDRWPAIKTVTCITSTYNQVERSCWIKALSFHLFDNDSYTIAQQSVGVAPTDHDRHNSSNSKEPVSIDCLHKPHYQPLDPFTRHNAIINVDDVTLEDKLTFRQLAMTHPNEMQLILLVKMQRMLCELQKEIHSQQSVKVQ